MTPTAPAAPTFTAADRRAVRAVALQFFINGALVASFVPRLPEIRDKVGLSVAGIGLLISVAGASGLIGSALVGSAIARWGTRRVMIAGSIATSAALALIGLSPTWAMLLLALIGASVFDVFVDVSMNLQGAWLSARRHTPVINRLHGLWSLGTLIGGFAASRVAAAGVPLSVHLGVAAVILVAILGYVAPGVLKVDEHSIAPDPTERREGRRETSPKLASALVAFGIAGVTAIAIEVGGSDWAAFRLTDDFGISAGRAALGYVAFTSGMTIARFLGDSISSRIGQDRMTMWSIVTVTAGFIAATLVSSPLIVLVGYLLAGLGTATLLPVMYYRAAHHAGRAGAGLGALTAGIRLGSLVTPLAIGGLAAALDRVGPAIALLTLPSIAGFSVVAMRLRRGEPHSASPG